MSTLNVTNIKAADGTSALTIANSTGAVTQTVQPSVTTPILVWARKNDTNAITSAGTINWNVEMIDTANAYNNTNGTFTCPRAGHYEVHWHYLHRFDGYMRTTLQKNGSHVWGSGQATIIYSNNNDNGDENLVSAFALVNCAVNDTLSIYLQDRSSNADIYAGGNSHNGFMVKFLG
tara:strand:+ start:455 stop:982 length:528 start_codon:yes stop_codon:yes gene_type:complete